MTELRRTNDAMLSAFDAGRTIGTNRVAFRGPTPPRRPWAGFVVPIGGAVPGSSYGAVTWGYVDPGRRVAVIPEEQGL